MKIQVVAVGKLKERFWKEACDEYLKRLKGYAKVRVDEVPGLRSGESRWGRGRAHEGGSLYSGEAARAFVCHSARCGRKTARANVLRRASMRWRFLA